MLAKQNIETMAKMAPNKMAPVPLQGARPSRRSVFLESKVREAGSPSNAERRDWSREASAGLTWADVTSGKPQERQRPCSASGARAASQRRSASQHRPALNTGKKQSNGSGSCGKQCKVETREHQAALQGLQKELQNLQTTMAALQLTINQQRETIARQDNLIRKLQDGAKPAKSNDDDMATDEAQEGNGAQADQQSSNSPNANPQRTLQTTVKTRSPTREAIITAARGLEEQPADELASASEYEEEEDDDVSTNNGRKARPLGYAGLNTRITRLEYTMKKWDKNFEALEQRIVNKSSQLIQQQLAQIQQQMLQQFTSMLQQHREEIGTLLKDGQQQ